MKAYCITNKITGKRYIGITKHAIERRWKQHVQDSRSNRRKHAILLSIKKYGPENFTIEQIASAKSWADVCAIEVTLIAQEGTKRPGGYNLTDGGEGVSGYHYSDDQRAQISARSLGRKHTDEAKRLIGLAGIGRKKSDEGRAAIGACHRGKPLSAEHRQKLTAAKIGKKLPPRSAEHSAKISLGLVAAHARRRRAND